MIRKYLFIILFFLLPSGSVWGEQTVLSVQSLDVAPYGRVVEGFENINHTKIVKIVLPEKNGLDVHRQILQTKPDVILTVGMGALAKVAPVATMPVVYSMILDPGTKMPGAGHATGIYMNIAPEVQLTIFRKMLTGIKAIGVIYDPEKSGEFIDRALQYAGRTGLRLIPEPVHSPKEVAFKLEKIKDQIDAFWMLPDVTVVTPETTEILLLFSLDNRIPILTFSEKYVEMGALLSIGIDPFDIGMQAGEMANRILNGTDIHLIPPEYAKKTIITFNSKIGEKLGVRLKGDALQGDIIIK